MRQPEREPGLASPENEWGAGVLVRKVGPDMLGRLAAAGNWCLKMTVRVLLLGLLFVVLVTVLHAALYVCPFRFVHFGKSGGVPVVYGLPSPEGFEEAKAGRIVLGGCVIRPVGAVCPCCHWPVRLVESEPEAMALDDQALESLSPDERTAIRSYVAAIPAQSSPDAEEWCTAVLVTPTDVWLGTLESGLQRFRRGIGIWKSYENGPLGRCIKSIRQSGSKIVVEHDPIGGHTFFREVYSEDNGETWLPS